MEAIIKAVQVLWSQLQITTNQIAAPQAALV